MPLTFTLHLSNGPIEFTRLVLLTHVDGVFNGKPQVWFSDYNRTLGQERNGITIAVQDRGTSKERVLYCGMLNNRRAAQDWLYAKNGFLFKERDQAAKAVEANHQVEIFFSSKGNAAQIIYELSPPWNA